MDDPRPSTYSPRNITAVFNVVPGDNPDLGDYQNEDPSAGDDGEYDINMLAPTMIITHGAYLILKEAAPSLEPHILMRLFFDKGADVLDYGPINGVTGEQYASWPQIYHTKRPSYEEYEEAQFFWSNLLQEEKTDEEILEEAWTGRGNLWATVRPDRFPIAETSTDEPLQFMLGTSYSSESPIIALPLELLVLIAKNTHPRALQNLMSTSKSVYSLLMIQADAIVHHYILQNEPWYLPAGPFDIPRGCQEVDWWKEQWSAKGISGDGMEKHIPWLRYRRACSHSMSMWNRIRIWRVVEQLERLAEELS
jgi:hypothetical protein